MDFYEDGNAVHTLDTNNILTGTFFRMFLGLLATAGTAIYLYSSNLYITMI